jgi:predicted nucleic acid-binding protein
VSDRIVVDASVAIKWVLPENLSSGALALRKRYALAAPDIIHAECANVLWKRTRSGEIAAEDSEEALDLLRGTDIHLLSSSEISPDALRLARDLDHPVYDCLYLYAAQVLQTVLVTADSRFVRKLQQSKSWANFVVDLGDMAVG